MTTTLPEVDAGPAAAVYVPSLADLAVDHHQVAVDLAVEMAEWHGRHTGYARGWRDGHDSAAGFMRRLGVREWCRQRQASSGEYVNDAVLRSQLAATQLVGVPRATTNAEHEAAFVLLRAVAESWKSRR